MAGVDSKPDRGGRTPLHYAALENDLRKIGALLDGGADPNAADRQGFTPLHFAAQQRSVEAARILLDQGAAVDPINDYGNTRSSWRCSTQKGVELSSSCFEVAVRTR
jgi:ankyrin repeat protein